MESFDSFLDAVILDLDMNKFLKKSVTTREDLNSIYSWRFILLQYIEFDSIRFICCNRLWNNTEEKDTDISSTGEFLYQYYSLMRFSNKTFFKMSKCQNVKEQAGLFYMITSIIGLNYLSTELESIITVVAEFTPEPPSNILSFSMFNWRGLRYIE